MKLEQARKALQAQLPDVIMSLRAKAAEHAPDAPAREAGFRIYNAAAEEATIRIYDEISWYGVNAADFTAALDGVTADRIRVELNSPGGDVFDGIAIYNALRNHPAHITTRIDGIAASIASIIAQAGDTRIAQPASQMMIHNAWGLVVGDTHDHSEMSSLLAQQDEVLAGIYATHSGKPAAEFRDLMNAETWLTADAMLEHGLVDEVVAPPKKDAPQDRGGFDVRSSIEDAPTLADEIAAAVDAVDAAIDSAARVAALRAEAGKSLSNTVRESLVGLQGRLEDIDDVLDPPSTDDAPVWTPEAVAALNARLVTRTREGFHHVQ